MILTVENVMTYIEAKQYSILRTALSEENPFDIAELLSTLPEEPLHLVFRVLPKDIAAETFVEMDSDSQELLIHSFTDKELRWVTEELFYDDIVDIIEELPANLVTRILANATTETRASINHLLK